MVCSKSSMFLLSVLLLWLRARSFGVFIKKGMHTELIKHQGKQNISGDFYSLLCFFCCFFLIFVISLAIWKQFISSWPGSTGRWPGPGLRSSSLNGDRGPLNLLGTLLIRGKWRSLTNILQFALRFCPLKSRLQLLLSCFYVPVSRCGSSRTGFVQC